MKEHDGQGCCCGCSSQGLSGISRRGFLAAGALAAALPAAYMLGAEADLKPRQQPIRRQLRVQPVFNCSIYEPKPATSWRVTGAIQDEAELRAEEEHICSDLKAMQAAAEFPLEVLPLVTVRTVEEAKAVAKGDFDAQVIYAARRDLPVLEALADNDKWNLMFVRHRSGPLYYMYIGSHTHFLRKRRDEFGQRNMGVHDIVVDDHGELLWRLRAFYALKNLRQKRVVAVGAAGGWGADGNLAPARAGELWNMDIRTVTYPELGQRIKKAQKRSGDGAACAGGGRGLLGPAWREARNHS